MTLSPAETEDIAWKHEAEIALLKLLVGELLSALPSSRRKKVLAGLANYGRSFDVLAQKPADLPEEAIARYTSLAGEDVMRCAEVRLLSQHKGGQGASFGTPPNRR